VSKAHSKKTGKRRATPRKSERSYARSISLRESQIRRLEEAGVANMSELFQGLVDGWLSARDKAEAARLREQAKLLILKWESLGGWGAKGEEAEATRLEWNRLSEKAKEIEETIKADERKKREVESERVRKEKARYQ
jgi:hypothetical protein